MSKPVVVVSAPIHPAGLELLRPHVELREVHHGPGIAAGASAEEFAAAMADADAVVIRSVPLPADLLRNSPTLKVIAKHGAGLDSVDLDAATELGIIVATSGNANSGSVAEHAVALMLAVMRRIPELDALVRAGGYRERERLSAFPDLFGSTVGIVGYGNIGRAVAEMLVGFRCEILVHDPFVEDSLSLDELLERSDVVTLHLPLTEETRHVIGAAELARMKPGAILVNTSRGGTVDEEALTKALADGTIRAAGLDVFEQEPPDVSAPLFAAPNVVLTPHAGGGTELARVRAATESAEAALAVLRGEQPRYVFNTAVLGHDRAGVSS
ncbi:hydroxyacid dehydrogenase [Pseudonocardia pini]|uniref:hydroxyacid dehydrogenase n=1 Tax=Pseudonocardia pini TaxID=2758030 RepID=UPI0015F07E70|nr:hydroxyacid dehydrogenase [Pseudonocardia pini]